MHRDGVHRGADPDDPNVDDLGHVALGDSRQIHPPMTACGTAHARQLIDADRERRSAYPPDSQLAASNTYYQVDRWDYEPDDVDVPGPLHLLPGHLDSAHWWAKEAIKAVYREDLDRRDYDLNGVQRHLAWAGSTFVDYLDKRQQAVGEEVDA